MHSRRTIFLILSVSVLLCTSNWNITFILRRLHRDRRTKHAHDNIAFVFVAYLLRQVILFVYGHQPRIKHVLSVPFFRQQIHTLVVLSVHALKFVLELLQLFHECIIDSSTSLTSASASPSSVLFHLLFLVRVPAKPFLIRFFLRGLAQHVIALSRLALHGHVFQRNHRLEAESSPSATLVVRV